MRVSAEILTQLEPRAQSYQHLSQAFERLTLEDVIHALARVSHPGARLLGRIKFAEQREFLTGLMQHLWPAVQELARERKWRADPARLRLLTFWTLYEYVKPPRCAQCKGTGSLRRRLFATAKGKKHNPTEPPVCPRCNGSTYEPLRDADYARALEMDEANWSKHGWRGKQADIRTILGGWEIDCLSEMLDFIDPERNA